MKTLFEGFTTSIPFHIVQHFELHWFQGDKRTKDNYRGIIVITSHTTWDMDADTWSNSIYLERVEADQFIAEYKEYISVAYSPLLIVNESIEKDVKVFECRFHVEFEECLNNYLKQGYSIQSTSCGEDADGDPTYKAIMVK